MIASVLPQISCGFRLTTNIWGKSFQCYDPNSTSRRSRLFFRAFLNKGRKEDQDFRFKRRSKDFLLSKTSLQVSGGGSDVAIAKDGNADSNKKFWLGRSLLVFVAFLYGTLYVCLRRVYTLSTPPITAAALSSTRGWLAAICFLPNLITMKTGSSNNQANNNNKPTTNNSQSSTSSHHGGRLLLWWTAMDLAIWNFLAQGLTNLGLKYCPSSARASFLIQSSVIFTPLLSFGLFGQKVSKTLWMGVGLAFAGLSILSGGGGAATTATVAKNWWQTIHPGDGMVLGGALCWSIYLLRLSRASSPNNNKHGMEFPPIPLQAIKTFLLAILYTLWWTISSSSSILSKSSATAAGATSSFWWKNGMVWFWLTISAIGPGALADVLQQKGQQYVSATEANIIMSSEPVFTAISGYLLLGETLARREIYGGTTILLAALVSSLSC